jgi:hypothetical protein
MLVARHDHRHRAGHARLTGATPASSTQSQACRRSTRLVPLPLLLLVVRLRRRTSVPSALRPGRDEHTPTARRMRGQHGVSDCVASALAPRARPRPPASPPRAAGPCNLPARAPSSRPTRAAPPCALPPPPQCSAARERRDAGLQLHSRATRRRSAAHAPAAACEGGSAAACAPAALGRAGALGGYGRSSETDFK